MLTLNDGRNELWQWDTGRTLAVDADCSQVHFSNKVFGRSNDVDVIDGIAIIPDILLQTDKDLTAWAFVGTAENGYTKISKTFKVNKRNKPADYVFTPPEQTSLEEIKEKLDYLESIQDPDAIKNAVDDYLEQNPIESPVQSVNGYTGNVKLTAEDVGAISQEDLQEATNEALAQAKASGEFDGKDGKDYVLTEADKQEIAQEAAELVEVPDVDIPTTLPNPHALTFTGAVEATYDGSEAVEVVIPQDGDGSEDWEFINSTTLSEDAAITVINSDSNGNSFKYKKLMVYAFSKNKTNQNVDMLALDANGEDLWGVGESIAIVLGDGVSATVTAEVIAERMVKQIGATLSNTIKEHFTYVRSGHSQNAKYAYLTGYKLSGNLSAGSVIELYGKGRVSA